jgi:hypothetical protein
MSCTAICSSIFDANRNRVHQPTNWNDAIMALTRPAQLRQCRIRLAREPVAAAEARGHVRAVIRDWKIPVDPDIAVLLTSDLVTNAILTGIGETITLAVRCSSGRLRIDVYDGSRALPTAGEPVTPEAGPGLALVAALAAAWGSFHTPAGKAVYFTLTFRTVRPD